MKVTYTESDINGNKISTDYNSERECIHYAGEELDVLLKRQARLLPHLTHKLRKEILHTMISSELEKDIVSEFQDYK